MFKKKKEPQKKIGAIEIEGLHAAIGPWSRLKFFFLIMESLWSLQHQVKKFNNNKNSLLHTAYGN